MKSKETQQILFREYHYTDDEEFADRIIEATKHEPLVLGVFWLYWLGILPFAVLAFISFFTGMELWKFYAIAGGIFYLGWLGRPKTLAQYIKKGKLDDKNPPPRPAIEQLEEALRQLKGPKQIKGRKLLALPPALDTMRARLGNLNTTLPVQKYLKDYHHEDWQNRFIARHALYRYGGEAIDGLLEAGKVDISEKDSRFWLIENIADRTHKLYSTNTSRYICPHCLRKFSRHKALTTKRFLFVPVQNISFYGCRACHQSKDHILCDRNIVAILDRKMEEIYKFDMGILLVNWLKFNKMFDFDRVMIFDTADKDVERFCIQVGDDINDKRDTAFTKMQCIIQCQLSENTKRILENTFGELIYK